MLKKILFAFLFLPIFAFADGSRGEKLLNHLWNDMKEGNVEKIKKYTSEDFQSVHFDGARDREQELVLIANLHMQAYSLTNVKITKERNLLIISYYAEVQTSINKTPYLEFSPTPRLTIFEKINGKWKWVAHANLALPTPD